MGERLYICLLAAAARGVCFCAMLESDIARILIDIHIVRCHWFYQPRAYTDYKGLYCCNSGHCDLFPFTVNDHMQSAAALYL